MKFDPPKREECLRFITERRALQACFPQSGPKAAFVAPETLLALELGAGFYTHRKMLPTMNDLRPEAAANPAGNAVPAVELNRVSRLYGSFVALREISLRRCPPAPAW